MNATQTWIRLLRPVLAALAAAPLVAVPAVVPAVPDSGPMVIPAEGAIGSGSERIAFSGQMSIAARIIEDKDLTSPPVLELDIDFGKVKGVGASDGRRFVTDAHTIVRRPLLAFDQIEVMFPYSPADNLMSMRTAKASLAVSFSAKSGVSITSRISSL